MPDVELPWMPLYVQDVKTSRVISAMTAEQFGVYMLLLVSQWEDGPIPDDDWMLSGIAKGSNGVRTVLERCFQKTPEGWVNVRLEEVRAEQLSKYEQKRKAGRASGKARRRKNIERRSNSVPTPLQRTLNDQDKEEDSKEVEKDARPSFPQPKAEPEGTPPSEDEFGVATAPLTSYLKEHVPPKRWPAYIATLKLWKQGGSPGIWKRPDGSSVKPDEHDRLFSVALTELPANDESTMARPVGDIWNLKTTLGVLISKEYESGKPRPRYNETPGADRTRSGPESTPVRISQIVLPERDRAAGVKLEAPKA